MRASRMQTLLRAAAAEYASPGRAPHVGEGLYHYMLWFAHLSNSRTYHMAGPNLISYAEIEAYCRLYHIPMQPRHVDILRAMDHAWMKAAMSKQSAPDGVKTAPLVGGEFNLQMFDVMFD